MTEKMEAVTHGKNIVLAVLAAIGSAALNLLGGWDVKFSSLHKNKCIV